MIVLPKYTKSCEILLSIYVSIPGRRIEEITRDDILSLTRIRLATFLLTSRVRVVLPRVSCYCDTASKGHVFNKS